MVKTYFGLPNVLASCYIVNFLVRIGEFGIAKVMLERFASGAVSLPWGASNVVSDVILVKLIGCFAMGNFMKSRWFCGFGCYR